MADHRIRRLAVGLAVCLVTVSACTSSGERALGDGAISQLLATVPDEAANRALVMFSDDDRAADLLDLERPPAADGAAAEAFALELAGPNGNVLVQPPVFAGSMNLVDEWRTAYGFSVADARAELTAGSPPAVLEVVTTELAPPTVAEAVRADPTWSDELSEVEHEGTPYYTWTDDPLAFRPELKTAPRPLGQGGALAIDDNGTIVRSTDPAVVTGALDASAHRAPSLLDDAGFAAVAGALESAGVYTATLSDQAVQLDSVLSDRMGEGETRPAEVEAALQQLRNELVTIPAYQVVGMGDTVADDGSPRIVLAYATGSTEAAEATVTATTSVIASGISLLTARPWSELLEVETTLIDGTLVVLTLRADHPGIAQQAFLQRDTLFISE